MAAALRVVTWGYRNAGMASPETKKHSNNFDLIRLFAAAEVMLTHGVAHLKLPIPTVLDQLLNAFPGVPIFFVVSGFLISGSYGRQKDVRSYATSRALRIYPALWVNLVGITIMLSFAGSLALTPGSLRFVLWHVVAFILGSDFLASNLIGGIFSGDGLFPFYPSGVLWTLPIELSFYVLAPIILAKRLAARELIGGSIAFWAVASLVCFFTIKRDGDWIVFVGLYLWIFLLGAAAQRYWGRLASLFEGRAAYWLVAHLALTAIVVIFTGSMPVYASPQWFNIIHTCTLAGVVLSCAYTLPNLAHNSLRDKDISYGLYLWHMPVFCVFIVAGLTGNWGYFLLASAIAVVIANLSRRLIEEPASRLKQKRRSIPAPV